MNQDVSLSVIFSRIAIKKEWKKIHFFSTAGCSDVCGADKKKISSVSKTET